MIGSFKNVSVIIKRFCQSKSRELNVNYRLNRGDTSVYLLVVLIGVLQLVMSLCQPFMIHRTEWFYFKYKIMAVFLSSNWTTVCSRSLEVNIHFQILCYKIIAYIHYLHWYVKNSVWDAKKKRMISFFRRITQMIFLENCACLFKKYILESTKASSPAVILV